MAGTIAGLGYSQRFGSNGRPLAGCNLYIYAGGTSTPASVYSDYALGQAHTFPIEADAAGIIPMFWVADGTYRVRLVDADGNEIFDDDGVVAIGPSSGTGGGGSSVEAAALFATGDFLWQPVTGTRTAWVRANARTIGSAASGAVERANADCEDLFLHLWNNYSDTLCPVTSGRGANAAADWAANKVIATLDMRDKVAVGLGDMGNTDLAAIVGGTPTAAGSAGGAEKQTIAQANLPSVNFTVTGTAATHTHDAGTFAVGTTITNGTGVTRNFSDSAESVDASGGTNVVDDVSYTSSTISLASGAVSGASAASGTLALTATAASGGSGTTLTTMPPYRLGTWFIKL